MTKSQKLLIVSLTFSVACGAFCALVRAGRVFESPFPSFYFILIATMALAAVAAYFVAAQSKADGRIGVAVYESEDASRISSDSHTLPVTFFMLLGAGLIAISCLRAFVTRTDTIDAINALLLFACAFTLALRALNKENSEKTAAFSLVPIYYLCLYLLMFYRDNAKGANVDAYGPQTLTISVLIFAAYFNCAVKFESRPPLLRYLSGLMAALVFTCELVGYFVLPSTLVCADPAFFLTMTGGFAIYFGSSLFTVPLRLFKEKPKKSESEKNSEEAADAKQDSPAENTPQA